MNNDRLKFRVWDKNNKRYIYFDFFSHIQSRTTEIGKALDISYSSCGDNLIDATYHLRQTDKVEQCTGLRDKNGTLIYEGDIVRYGSNTSMGVVKYGEFNCSCCEGVYGWYFDNEEDIRNYEYYEVIGNIHEQKDK